MLKKKSKLKLYKRHIADVVIDISQVEYWRQRLFSERYDKKFLISSDSENIPKFLKNVLLGHSLQFLVSKVIECPEQFDDGCIIFKFESVEFPEIVMYSGN